MKKTHIIWIVLGVITFLIFLIFLSRVSTGRIALIEINGTITSSRSINRLLRRAREDFSIKGVVIRVSSPGGGVVASQEIMEGIKKLKEKKPVVISMGAVAASGGYYISLPATVIMANRSTVTGSIGVIMELPKTEELMKKIGIEMRVIKSREFKDIGSPFRDMKPEERELLKGLILDMYDQFVKDVAKYRNLPEDSVYNLADGRVFTGIQAKEAGLIDTLGTLEDAVNLANKLAGLHGKPRVIKLEEKKSFLEEIIFGIVEKKLSPAIEFLWLPD